MFPPGKERVRDKAMGALAVALRTTNEQLAALMSASRGMSRRYRAAPRRLCRRSRDPLWPLPLEASGDCDSASSCSRMLRHSRSGSGATTGSASGRNTSVSASAVSARRSVERTVVCVAAHLVLDVLVFAVGPVQLVIGVVRRLRLRRPAAAPAAATSAPRSSRNSAAIDPEQRDERRQQHRLRHRRGERRVQEGRQLGDLTLGLRRPVRRAGASWPTAADAMNAAMPALPSTEPTWRVVL